MDKERVIELIKFRQTIESDDPVIQEIWSELSRLLSESLTETIEFLESCSTNEIYWISEVFDDVSFELNNINFVNCIISLQLKHKSINIQNDIYYAKRMLK